MQYLFDGNKTDWVASTAFYAMYHALLSILYKLGYESRNQECSLVATEKAMKDKKNEDKVRKDISDGRKFGVNSTPTFFLDGKKLDLYSHNDLKKAVSDAIKK